MDFTLDESQEELRKLAAEVLSREAATERLEACEASGAPYDVSTWKAMAQAGLLGACLPADVGGAGLGPVELTVLLREVGAHVAPVPAFATLALGAAPIGTHGTAEQRALLSEVADGERVLTAAIREPGTFGPPLTTAHADAGGYLLDGVKIAVPYARQAVSILVPATVEGGGVAVFLVSPDSDGLSHDRYPTSTGEPASRLGLHAVRVPAEAMLGRSANGAAAATLDRFALAGASAVMSGVLAEALALTTEHVKTREQFGRPLAEFQAVTMQIGDVYIAARGLDAALWAGCWRLAEGRDDTDETLAIAAFNAADVALNALYTCHHLHGGLGLDVTYPLHRFFAWGKQYAHLLGGAEARLDIIGDHVRARAAG